MATVLIITILEKAQLYSHRKAKGKDAERKPVVKRQS